MEKVLPLPKWVVGEWVGVAWEVTSRGVMGLLAAVLVCTGTLVMHVRAGPIYVVVGTCPSFC